MFPEREYLLWLEERNLSSRTIKEYGYYLRKLIGYGELNQENLDNFLRRWNNNMARSMLKSIRKFLLRNKVETNLSESEIRILEALDIPESVRKPRKKPEVLSREEIQALHDSFPNERNRVILLISYYCALRVSETFNIKRDDFNWVEWKEDMNKNGKLRIPHGKGGTSDIVLVPPRVMLRVMNWVNAVYNVRDFDPDKPLFKIKPNTWAKQLAKYSQKALNRHVKTHTLRHSFATYLIENGWNLREVQEHLRHADISSTQIYTHISKKHLDSKFTLLLGNK